MEDIPAWKLRIEEEKKRRTGKLDLKGFSPEIIPMELAELDWLSDLDLSDNQILKIEHLEGLKKLKTLDLANNKISKIENLGGLKELTSLDIGDNQISKIENLEGLKKLKKLDIQSNKILKIENLEELKELTSLNIGYNQTSKIENLEKLIKLTGLHLYRNQIKKIENLETLTALQYLSIWRNKIKKIENLRKLKNLETLNLDYNQIEKIEGLELLTKMTMLTLPDNKISRIENLATLKKLNRLELQKNQIGRIENLEGLNDLQELYLSANAISSLEELPIFNELKILDLEDNAITTLKPILSILGPALKISLDERHQGDLGVFVRNNNLDIPLEIVKQGNEAILKFYGLQKNTSSATDEIYLNEAKLILVGEGKTGKTSLRVKLINAEAQLPTDDERTRGIDIEDYSFALRNNENYTAHIWDFGGQNIQYALHRFFMTGNSLYILMTESRNERDKNFMYWFQNIDLFGGKDSPILIVMNLMHGDRGSNIDIASYTGEFKKIVNNEILEVNLLNPEQSDSLQKLRTIIEQQLENLPHIRKPIFRCWLDVRQALQEESKKHPYISIERYQELCVEHEVDEPYFEILGRYLHNLGIVLWYHDKEYLRNKMILNPMWATTAIYKIIDDKKIQENKGKFDNADKNRLWSDPVYRFSKDELTSLLKIFKICFQRQNKDEYIVPALMDANPPLIAKDWVKEGCTTVSFEYVFMPKGIANQLTADMYRHIADDLNHVWAYGVVLHYDEDKNTIAMITENTYNKVVSIQVKGNYASRFMGIIIQDLKNINNSYEGLKCDMKIPCNCKKCRSHADPQKYTEKDLLEKLDEGKTRVYCNRLDDKIDIQPILESVGINHPIFDRRERDNKWEAETPGNFNWNKAQKAAKVFISYAHAQNDYFKVFSEDLKSYLPALQYEIFDDFQIPLGQKWDEFLQNQVSTCDIIILLVSQEFIASDYIKKNEFGAAISRLKTNNDGLLVIPVYFAPCNFGNEDDLKSLQFFKPHGAQYEQANKENKFSYCDLVKFRETDGRLIPNNNRKQYMLDFIEKLEKTVSSKEI